MRQIEATGLILLKQWNNKLPAKQVIEKIFQLPVQPLSAPLMGKGKQHIVLQGGNNGYRDLIVWTNRQEEMLFQIGNKESETESHPLFCWYMSQNVL